MLFIIGLSIGLLARTLQSGGKGQLLRVAYQNRYQWFPAEAAGCQACGGAPCPCQNWRL